MIMVFKLFESNLILGNVFWFDRLNILCASGKYLPSNGAAGRAGGLNMAFDPHKAKNAGAEGLCGVSLGAQGVSWWKQVEEAR